MTYEKLPDFCYGCGLLGHTIKECEQYRGLNDEALPYGPWLREPTRLKVREQNFQFSSRGRGRGGDRGRGSWRTFGADEEIQNQSEDSDDEQGSKEKESTKENISPPEKGDRPTTAIRTADPTVIKSNMEKEEISDLTAGVESELNDETVNTITQGNMPTDMQSKTSLMELDQIWDGSEEDKWKDKGKAVEDLVGGTHSVININEFGQKIMGEKGKNKKWKRIARMQYTDEMKEKIENSARGLAGQKHKISVEDSQNKKQLTISNEISNVGSAEAAGQPRRTQ